MASTPADRTRQREVNARVSTLLMRAALVMEQRKAEAVAPFELTLNQYVAMLWLRCNPGISNAGLARHCGITPQACSALVAILETRGLARRGQSPAHGRLLEISLTTMGKKLADRADGAAAAVDRVYAAEFETNELERLRVLLQRASTALA